MKIGDSIRAARKAKKWTLEKLAHEVGTDPGNLSRLERNLQSVNKEVMDKILWVLGLSVSVEGPGISSEDKAPTSRDQVPLISWVKAGCWSEVADIYADSDAEALLPCPVSHSYRAFALKIRTESMFNPHERHSFRDGDVIFVDPMVEPVHRSLVVIKLEGAQEATFRQLIIEGSQKYLKALNPAWPEPIILANENTTLCGVAIAKHEPLI